MKTGCQNDLIAQANAVCLVLCYAECANRLSGVDLTPSQALSLACSSIFVDDEMYVRDGASFLHDITGDAYSVTKVLPGDYITGRGDICIYMYEEGSMTHACMDDFDPYIGSRAKALGKLVSVRIVRRVR